MKVVFVTNYYNHHQKVFSRCMYNYLNEDFSFIETSKMSDERKQLGYGERNIPRYVLSLDRERTSKAKIKKLINEADVVIMGSAPNYLIRKRIRLGGIIFRYSEHPVKKKMGIIEYNLMKIKLKWKNSKRENNYLLAASAYAASEYAEFGLFKNRSFKWGYFPITKIYADINSIILKKKKNSILWCGRFINWKNPEHAIEVARRLKKDGYDFEMNFIGIGPQYDLLREYVVKLDLEENVRILGPMSPEQVRKRMEETEIFLFTSNHQEGWGVVLNEAMNSACAVVANYQIGSVPFLINNMKNGILYENEDIEQLYRNVKYLIDNHDERVKISKEAYETIVSTWNGEIATKRLIELFESIMTNTDITKFDEGPCSNV